MNNFKDFGITPQTKGFAGEKIKVDKILNKQITVEKCEVKPSKLEKGCGKCLYAQLIVDGERRLLMIGSATLIDMIEQVPANRFPFQTTIVKEDNRLMFT